MLRKSAFFGTYFDTSADKGSGHIEDDEGTQPPQQKALDSLLTRHDGDASKVALQLLSENFQLRARNRELRDHQVQDGYVSVPKADADLLAEYKALGDVKVLSSTQAELQKSKRDQVVTEAALAHKFRPQVLGRLLQGETIEMRAETVDGKQTPFAVVLSDGKEAVRLDQYAETNWSDFIPALQETASQGTSGTSQGDKQTVTVPRQSRGQAPEKKDPVAERIAARQDRIDKSKSPLSPSP